MDEKQEKIVVEIESVPNAQDTQYRLESIAEGALDVLSPEEDNG